MYVAVEVRFVYAVTEFVCPFVNACVSVSVRVRACVCACVCMHFYSACRARGSLAKSAADCLGRDLVDLFLDNEI